ncbi:MAG: AbrB/MazE/SpoVT family DNA-binding domain-containing protein [Gammaproteobacteria bacterium]|nr:AbrB/MazE/SpoVT family DNA-binding domain-containing protein [Gammaproteobacteria bacterium]MDE0283748.1 AbrB/MazE/SpoVT family DNA-binding domain-containing protein [Gammaproteobacteria bacterium]MDE0511058.1 AbrB/MazE/SpoVT family DNA-binding domain-containing protein [Gammaproteobacteria bacterium]
MSFVTVKPKFQITIPAKLRRDINLHEGDIMEAVLIGNSILFKPKQVVDRELAADRIAARFAEVQPAPGDIDRGEDEIINEAITDISMSRRERRYSEA